MKRTARQKLKKLRKSLMAMAAYPEEGHDRRSEDGYPSEVEYDEFAYKRMVDSFRDAITRSVKRSRKH